LSPEIGSAILLNKLQLLALLLLAGLVVAACGADSITTTTADSDTVYVTAAWARPAEQGATSALYFDITNATSQDVRLIAVEVEVAAQVMLHMTTVTNDVAQMQMQDGFDLAAGQTLRLEPLSSHAMLINLQQALDSGSMLPFTLVFEDGTRLEGEAAISDTPVDGDSDEHGMTH
jgi:copper(I)-binding protein